MFYRQSIALFGIVLPLVIALLVVGGVFYATGTIKDDFAEKEQKFKTYEDSRIGALKLEAEGSRKREYVEQWKAKLSEETKSALSSHLKKIQEKLPKKEFQITSNDATTGAGGFGSVSAQKSTQIRLGLRGTFRTVQKALLELETQMPQLQLTELKIDPSSSQTSLLNFDVSYTAWEN